MSEIHLASRPALPHPAIRGAAVTLAPLPEGHVLLALAPALPRAAGAGDIEGRLAAIGDGGPHAVRRLSPGQWLVVGDKALSAAERRAKAEALAGVAAVSDQSHGRVRVALGGPAAEAILAKGCGVDLSLTMFPVGQSAQTLHGHIGVHITRTAPDAFELMVLRGFAQSLWHDLARLAKPYLA